MAACPKFVGVKFILDSLNLYIKYLSLFQIVDLWLHALDGLHLSGDLNKGLSIIESLEDSSGNGSPNIIVYRCLGMIFDLIKLFNYYQFAIMESVIKTQEQQDQFQFLAKADLYLWNFKNLVVSYGFDFNVEQINLESTFSEWKTELYAHEGLTDELKDSINSSAQKMKKATFKDCLEDPIFI